MEIQAEIIIADSDIEYIVAEWVGNNFQEQLDMADHSNLEIERVDPDDDAFVNAVAKAIYNMARNYVGA
tara:strand:- start:264 stop:470 length:207 start_codon:yes stop_codon:yes gene_type:complete